MKYCLNYKPYKEKEYKDVDELKIKYNPDDKSLFDFLQKHKDKVINIYVSAAQLQDKSNIRLFKGFIAKGCTNFKLIITFMQDNRENVDALKAEKIPFFFSAVAADWQTFYLLLSYGPTDIYILGGLGFELDKLSKIAQAHNCSLRIYPNVCGPDTFNDKGLKNFYVRPEDINFYSRFVSVCEFYTGDDIDRELVYYKIYAKDKKWWGPLNEIIIGLGADIDNRYIGPEFSWFRSSCGQKCIKGESCKICSLVIEMSHHVAERENNRKDKKSK